MNLLNLVILVDLVNLVNPVIPANLVKWSEVLSIFCLHLSLPLSLSLSLLAKKSPVIEGGGEGEWLHCFL